MNYLSYWGKARPEEGGPATHPAAYHCLDVAACGSVLLDRMPLLRSRLARLLDIDAPAPFLTAWIALHDLGKWSRPFQTLIDAEPVHGLRHDAAGFWYWRERMRDVLPLDLMPIARAVFGHHGQPVSEEQSPRLRVLFGSGAADASAFAFDVLGLLKPGSVGPDADLIRASWLVAGLTVLSDWLGSSQSAFPYERPDRDLATYWTEIALPRAREAVTASGAIPAPSAPVRDYPALTGIKGWRSTPMQSRAETVEPLPGLYIIEDSTGAGKTEAAVMLAHRLIAAGHADGLYIALPTMATSDGMYDRMAEMYRAAFEGRPSLALAHGARSLHEGFRTSILDPNSDSYCSEWIADDRRRTFLAQVGVGTIDQAILGVLPSRHQCLRVLGLSQRVLVLDEVHAYDAYVTQEIVRLLEMQAALGGSTILLSATLPAEVKRRLLRAYGGTAAEFSTAYPLATVQAETFSETPVEPRTETVRRVPLRFVETPEEGLGRAIAAARDGQAVLYIRNTIADAMETFESLPADIDADLFHARFAMCDRQRIQSEALARFGRDGTDRARLLIATQVVEQSLDLDFDLIVSDLAPVDLIIQRAGRLWRHTRERPASAVREFVVVGPTPAPDAGVRWLSEALPRTSRVYRDHARMWLTAEGLRRHGEINAPDDLRTLIEHVYGPHPRVPEGLAASLLDIEGRSAAERGVADLSSLSLDDGYFRSGPWDSDERIMTRLSELPTVTVRLAVARDGVVLPWASEGHIWKRWALSEVRVPEYLIPGDLITDGLTDAAETARQDWTAWQREDMRLVIVNDDGTTADNVIYCPRVGLRRSE